MEYNSFPIIYEIEDVDLHSLEITHVNSLYPISSLDEVRRKVSRKELKLFVNSEISSEELERLTTFSERMTYILIGRIPLITVIGISILGFFFNYFFLLLILAFPLSYYLAPVTYGIRHVIYTTLLIISAILALQGNLWVINLCITIFFLLMVWRQNISTQLIQSVIRHSLKSDANFLKNYLSNRIILASSEKIFNRTEDVLKIVEDYFKEYPRELSMEDRLYFCKRCDNKGFDKYEGVVCGLTNKKPSFQAECTDYRSNKWFGEREDMKEAKRISWYSDAVFSTQLSFTIVDLITVGLVISGVKLVLIGGSIPFLQSGLSLYLIDQGYNFNPLIHFALPSTLFLLNLMSRLRNPFCLILAAIFIGLDALPLVFLGDFTLEPHLHIGLALSIGSGYLNIKNAKIYVNGLPSSNAYLNDYFHKADETEE